MAPGAGGQGAAARRALDEALLQQERFDDILDRVARFRERRRDRLNPDRAAAEVLSGMATFEEAGVSGS